MDVLSYQQRTSKFLNGFMKFMAISPLEKSSLALKFCAISILVVILGTFCFEIYGRWNTNFNVDPTATKRTAIISTLNTMVAVLCNVVVTLHVFVFKEKFGADFLEEINQIDSTLRRYVKVNQKRKSFSFHLMILNIFYVGIFCNDLPMLFFSIKLKHQYLYYCFDQFYRYRISILVLYIYHLMSRLLEMITAINMILRNTFEEIRRKSEDLNCSETLVYLQNFTRDVSGSYAAFVNVIYCFNRAFGWQILFIFLNYICLLMVTYEAGLRKIATYDGTPIGLCIWFTFTMTYAMVGAAVVTSICDKTSNEARKTADLSFYYYYNLNISKYHPGQACLAKNLTLLIRQARNSLTTFSAAEFFSVNYSTLFLLINLLTTYLIVLIQFG